MGSLNHALVSQIMASMMELYRNECLGFSCLLCAYFHSCTPANKSILESSQACGPAGSEKWRCFSASYLSSTTLSRLPKGCKQVLPARPKEEEKPEPGCLQPSQLMPFQLRWMRGRRKS